jgi:hypothetical protein
MFKIRHYTKLLIFSGAIFSPILCAKDLCTKDQPFSVNGEFMKANDLTWSKPLSPDWDRGAFIGDGIQGAMIMRDNKDENALRILMGRYDVTANYSIPEFEYCIPRVNAGSIILTPESKTSSESMRMNIWDGIVSGSKTSSDGSIHWSAFTDRKHGVFLVQSSGAPHQLFVREEWGISTKLNNPNHVDKISKYKDQLPAKPVKSKSNGVDIITQKLFNQGAYVVASKLIEKSGQKTLFVAIGVDNQKDQDQAAKVALTDALRRLNAAIQEGAERITKRHKSWWNNYMSKGGIHLPQDPEWEKFWWLQIYKFASASSETSSLSMDNIGPWPWECDWGAVWWNLNIQLAYAPAFTANRLDVGKSFISAVDRHYAGKSFRNSAGKSPGITVTRSMHNLVRPRGEDWAKEYGNLSWVLYNYWRYWKYSGDDTLAPKLFKMLKENAEFLISKLEKQEDGKLHMTESRAPEYHVNVKKQLFKDTNYGLMSLDWVLKTLIQMNADLHYNDESLVIWKQTLKNLTPFPADDKSFWIDGETPYAKSHRHYSHLLAIYPYHTFNPDNDSQKAFIESSVDHWLSLSQSLQGYSFTGSCAMLATLNKGDKAIEKLDELKRYLHPNTMYLEGRNPVLETPLAAVESIDYLLLQSWGGKLRVFPAVPSRWKDVDFKDLRAEGAFLVSGTRREGKTQSITIKSLKGGKCTVVTDIKKPILQGKNPPLNLIQRNGFQEFTIALKKGESVTICAE